MSLFSMPVISRNQPSHREKFIGRINESLLKLALKLQDTDVRINGSAAKSHTQRPTPRKVSPGVLSVIGERGHLSFTYHNGPPTNAISSLGGRHANIQHQTTPAAELRKPVAEMRKPGAELRKPAAELFKPATELRKALTSNENVHINSSSMSTRDRVDSPELLKIVNVMSLAEDDSLAPPSIESQLPQQKVLSVPQHSGPSLWPLMSNVKASADAENVEYINEHPDYFSHYNTNDLAAAFIEPLTSEDYETLIETAINSILDKPNFWSRVRIHPMMKQDTAKFEFKKPGKPPPISINQKPLRSIQPKSESLPICELSTSKLPVPAKPVAASKPNVVPVQHNLRLFSSKRYAASIANPRRFRCDLCPYSTNNRSHVNRHYVSVHSSARPYRCYVCGKEFARSENGRLHIKTWHPDVPFSLERMKSSQYSELKNSSPKPVSDTAAKRPKRVSNEPPVIVIKPEPPVPHADESTSANSQPVPVSMPFPVQLWNNQFMVGQSPVAVSNIGGFNQFAGNMVSVKTEPGLEAAAHGCLCPRCQLPCRDATHLLQHLAEQHASSNASPYAVNQPIMNCAPTVLNSAAMINTVPQTIFNTSPQLVNTGSGYVFLQTASPFFILPQVPVPMQSVTPIAASAAAPSSAQPTTSPDSVSPKKHAASGLHRILPKAGNVVGSISVASSSVTATPKGVCAASKVIARKRKLKGTRVRQFKIFLCSLCPERAPFRYQKSFDKHVYMHRTSGRVAVNIAPAPPPQSAKDKNCDETAETQPSAESSEAESDSSECLEFKDDPNDPDYA